MSTYHYHLQRDTTAQGITVLITVFLAVIIYAIWRTTPPENIAVAVISTVFIVLIYTAAYLFHPSGYCLTATHLEIKRPIGKKRFLLTKCTEVRELQAQQLKGSHRNGGVGGLWGYFGGFNHKTLGEMTWYITSRKHTLLLYFSPFHKILISPVEIEEFKTQLQQLTKDLPIEFQ